MTIWSLGINPGVHDSSAALTRDGVPVVLIEQERVSREKRAPWVSPAEAIDLCLRYAGISTSDLSTIALGWDMPRLSDWLVADASRALRNLELESVERLFPESRTSKLPPIERIRHHDAHAASASWASGFASSAVLVMDNRGEDASTSIYRFSGDSAPVLVESFPINRSLGIFYRAATEYAGLYSSDGTAGKLMGLASYGRPRQSMPLSIGVDGPRLDVLEDEWPRVDLHRRLISALLDRFTEGYPYISGSPDVLAYADFAASAQEALERAIVWLARRARQLTGETRLAIAGGVALNCTANGLLEREGVFDAIFVQPVSSDAGVALGAAYAAAGSGAAVGASAMLDAQLGVSWTREEILSALRAEGEHADELEAGTLDNICAKLVANGAILGWFQDRAEVGPRALGGRSILADPRRREVALEVNRRKGRELWRPLAPTVLEERFADYFDGAPDRFMIKAAVVKPGQRLQVPAIVHVDGSARPQIVRSQDSRIRGFLEEFARLTGVPMVLNTSFNVRGEPIVHTPTDAIRSARSMKLDALAIGPFLVQWSNV